METGILELVTRPTAIADKRDILNAVDALRARYENGGLDVNPLRDLIVLKQVETFVKEAIKVAMPWATQDAANLNDKERKCIYNAKLSLREASPTYDFSGNAEWQELKDEEDAYAEQAKMAQNRRKAVEKNLILAGAAKMTSRGEASLAVTIL